MKILFMGTPDIAAESLDALIKAGHEICAVFTRRDKPVGRKQILTAPPVKQMAEKTRHSGIPAAYAAGRKLRRPDPQALPPTSWWWWHTGASFRRSFCMWHGMAASICTFRSCPNIAVPLPFNGLY